MEYIKDNVYAIQNNNQEHLRELGFYCKKDTDTHTYKFPVYKYKNRTLLECVITAQSYNNKVIIDVYDLDNKNIYNPYYNNEYGYYTPIIEKINKKILAEFKKLGITKWQKK